MKLDLSKYTKKMEFLPYLTMPFKIRLFNDFFEINNVVYSCQYKNIYLTDKSFINSSHGFTTFNYSTYNDFKKCYTYFVVKNDNTLIAHPIIGFYYNKESNITLCSNPDVDTLCRAYVNDEKIAIFKMMNLLGITNNKAQSIFEEAFLIQRGLL